MALPGYRNGKPYLHSHMLAVLPRVPQSQASAAASSSPSATTPSPAASISWSGPSTPLEIKNAHLNIARLGAIVRRYQPNFYGATTRRCKAAFPPIALYAEWWLRSSRVARALRGEAPAPSTIARTRRRPARNLRLEAGPQTT